MEISATILQKLNVDLKTGTSSMQENSNSRQTFHPKTNYPMKRLSQNSILLDSIPQDPFQRLFLS